MTAGGKDSWRGWPKAEDLGMAGVSNDGEWAGLKRHWGGDGGRRRRRGFWGRGQEERGFGEEGRSRGLWCD